ncbi:GGDEF domain-containing protein [Cohnella sp.]|uniref:GGDEF domain-containing protein n=1 Tax=Cohnella sp. TaxID=1883426 RepID=UPI00356A74C5
MITSRNTGQTTLVIGVIFGLIGIVQMLFSIEVSPTVIMDLRSIAIVSAAVIGGWHSSVLASLIIALGRVLLFGGFTTAAELSSISAVATGIGCGIIVHYFEEYRKKWIFLLAYSALLPAIVVYLLLQEKSPLVIFTFLPVYLISGAIIAYAIYYLDLSKSLYLKYEAEAGTDYLTGLLNYRTFDSEFNRMLQQAEHKQESFSVLLIDIDYFKQINDSYGHKMGDEVLKQFAAVLTDSKGYFNNVFRIGGEEFAVLLDACPHGQALMVADKIGKKTRECKFSLSDKTSIPITASIGVATFPEVTKENLLEYADSALYRAKKTGRNKVVSYAMVVM